MSEPVLPHAAQTLDVDMKSLLAGLTPRITGAQTPGACPPFARPCACGS